MAALLSAVLAALLGGAAYYFVLTRSAPQDADLRDAFQAAASTQNYSQIATTEVILSDRHIRVEGIYRIDRTARRFASFATTTVVRPDVNKGSQTVRFSVSNIVVDDEVYTSVETDSPLLLGSIPLTHGWLHFGVKSIPERFANIAATGPVLDNLLITERNGAYLQTSTGPSLDTFDEKPAARYVFKLSNAAFDDVPAQLQVLFGRIGRDGIIDVWIEPNEHKIVGLRFQGPDYVSTTSIQYVYTPLTIEPPTDWRNDATLLP